MLFVLFLIGYYIVNILVAIQTSLYNFEWWLAMPIKLICCNLIVLQPWTVMVSILRYYKQAYNEVLPHLPVTCYHLPSQSYLVIETALARMTRGSLLGEHLLFLTELFRVPCWLFFPSWNSFFSWLFGHLTAVDFSSFPSGSSSFISTWGLKLAS